ncbi:MAG: PAQR family membrane homeostasis protein TrhA [Robiginitalea sp.]
MKITYRDEELWNTWTHGLGILLGVIGAIFMLFRVHEADSLARTSVWIYSISVIVLFTASTVYHAVAAPRIKRKRRILDHISIYILIAGTYSPVALITLREGSGWWLFGAVWGMALFGTVLKLFFTGKFELFSLFLYLLMGWLIAIDLRNLLDHLTPTGKGLLMAGGAFYTVGILFYAIRKIPFNHMIWHFFVLAGALCHWLFIYLDVVPG